MTSAASDICGTHFGETNEVVSTFWKPASESRLMSSTLTSVEMNCFSFCRPSRGDTSTIFTFAGVGIVSPGLNLTVNNTLLATQVAAVVKPRSEERRVGKERRTR